MPRKLLISTALALVLLMGLPLGAQADPVDTILMLVVDVSGSINAIEYRLMMQGYSQAFRDAQVRESIYGATSGGTNKNLALRMVFFDNATTSTGWFLINDDASADAFANYLWDGGTNHLPRPLTPPGQTDIAAGIDLGYSLAAGDNPYTSDRKIMDVSGDGSQNRPQFGEEQWLPLLHAARDQALGYFDVISGITVGDSSLRDYYADNVIGGEGAFAVHANDFNAFIPAIREKVYREISGGEDAVPEPGTWLLLGSAVGVLGFWRRRKSVKI